MMKKLMTLLLLCSTCFAIAPNPRDPINSTIPEITVVFWNTKEIVGCIDQYGYSCLCSIGSTSSINYPLKFTLTRDGSTWDGRPIWSYIDYNETFTTTLNVTEGWQITDTGLIIYYTPVYGDWGSAELSVSGSWEGSSYFYSTGSARGPFDNQVYPVCSYYGIWGCGWSARIGGIAFIHVPSGVSTPPCFADSLCGIVFNSGCYDGEVVNFKAFALYADFQFWAECLPEYWLRDCNDCTLRGN